MITSFRTLMQLAYNLGQAKKSKDIIEIEKADKLLTEYKELIKLSDGMTLNCYKNDLI